MIRQAFPKSNDKVVKSVMEVLDSGNYVKGPQAEKFEQSFSEISGCKYNLTVNSGTSALNLILYALNYPSGSEIIIPANTFLATGNAVETSGYTTKFVDVDMKTFNLDIDKLDHTISSKTKAIIVVHLYGLPANIEKVIEIASKHNIDVIEDSCQAHYAEYNGKKIGSFGIASAFSFFPTKNLSVLGDGGMISTNDEALYNKLLALRNAGRIDHPDDAEYFGFNYRLSEVSAAVGNALLTDFKQESERRKEIAELYHNGLQEINQITVPQAISGATPVWHQYTIIAQERDKLKEFLYSKAIQTSIKYSIPLHLVQAYKNKYGYKGGEYPVSEQLANTILCLPMHPFLSNEEVNLVITEIKNFYFTHR